MHTYHCLILGAGAAGLHAAAFAVKGGNVLVIDHAPAPGEKIRISGGGRCNFTNLNTTPEKFISENPHFAKSVLSRYSEWDFVELVKRHRIPFHEKAHGQLFCDTSSKDIINMLLAEMRPAELRLCTSAMAIDRTHEGFEVTLSNGGAVLARNLVVASGGKSIPKMGATGVGYRIAEDFGHRVTETRPGLVPLTFDQRVLERFAPLAGVGLPVRALTQGASFEEAMLFTHRGLSGPAILQLSSYWREGGEIELNLSPEADPFERLRAMRAENGRRSVATALSALLPTRLASDIAAKGGLGCNLADLSDQRLRALSDNLSHWRLRPLGTEGYRTAEVTVGGVSTNGLNTRTLESLTVPGLFFIGEVVDVTGWLGGYNFQWAWSSAFAAGTEIARRAGAQAA
jgi:predicted Rossmann fold flavoprotein